MANDLKISLTASLNTGKSIGEINTAIGGIEKKVKALKLNIEINDKVLNTLNNFTKQLNKISAVAKDTGKVIQEVINPDGSKTKLTFFNGLKGEFAQVSTVAKKSASDQVSSLEQVSKEFDKVTKQVERYNAAQQKVGGSTSLSNLDGTVRRTVNTDANNKVKSFNDTYDYAKDEKLIAQMEQFRLQSMQRRAQEERAINQAQQQAIQKNAEIERAEIAKTQAARQAYEQWWQQAIAQRTQQERKANQATINSLDEYKRKAEIQANGLLNNKNKLLSPDQVSSLNNYLSAVKGLNAQTPQLASKMKSLGLDFKEISANAQQASHHSMSFGDSLKMAFSRMGMMMGVSTLMFQTIAALSNGIKTVNELNKALTEVSIVTGKSQEQVSQLGEEYNKLAKNMGVTTVELSKTAASLYRQGLSDDEVKSRMQTVTEYAKISSLDVTSATEIMTAAINSMGVSAERASDVWSYLGDATATGADEIGRAMQKVGGSAGALNLNFEKVSSWVATISARTRESAETIGQSLKGILARIQNMKEYGFDEADGTKVNQVAKALAAVDVALMDSNGQFRNFGTVMDELGAKWKDLDSRQKAYISTTVAGKKCAA